MGNSVSLRVLFVARWYPSHDQPGRGSFVADLVSALRATGVEVVVASFEATHIRGPVESRAERGLAAAALLAGPVGSAGTVSSPRAWGADGTPVARLPVFLDAERRGAAHIVEAHSRALLPFGRGLAGRWPIDVVHAHTGLPDGAAAARLADELGVGLLVTEHSSTAAVELEDAAARELYARLLSGRRRVVAVGRGLADHVARAVGADAAAIEVLPNAVPVEDFPSHGAAERDPDELLYVGSRKASKGIETLLRAFAAVRAGQAGLSLRLIGSPGQPADEVRWRAVIDELALGGAVSIEPAVPRAGVAQAMQRAGLFVHPSPHETFGMVAAEALASGLPVVTTPSGGVDDIVGSDERFGVVAGDADPGGLAAAIARGLVVAPSVDRAAMRAYVEGRFAAAAVSARTVDLYRSLMPPASVAAPSAPPAPAPEHPPFSLPLVLALARGQAIDRVGQLPPELARRLTIVTSRRGKYADDRDLPAWGRWLEYDPDRFSRDAAAALGRAVPASGLGRLASALTGRGHRTRPEAVKAQEDEIRRAGIERFFREAMSTVGAGAGSSSAGSPTKLLGLDADDVLLAGRLGGSSAQLAPGGLRWLADAWDEAGRPGWQATGRVNPGRGSPGPAPGPRSTPR